MANITYGGPLRSKGGFDFMVNSNAVIQKRVRHTKVPTASVLALFGTPYEVLPAIGAGNFLKFDGAVVFQDYAAAAYDDNGNEEDVTIQLGGGGAAVGWTADSTLIDAAEDFAIYIHPKVSSADAGTSVVWDHLPANSSLEITVATSEIITGDSDWDVLVMYTVFNKNALEALTS